MEATAIESAIVLDPTEPFLDDHRPGGDPLLGTTMSLDLLLRAARAGAVESWPTGGVISDIEAIRPVIVTGGSSTVTVCLDGDGVGGHHGAVVTDHGDRVVHLTAHVRADRPGRAPALAPIDVGHAPAVDASEIYGVFFHGPAFRVIRRAWSVDGMLVAEVATGLPGLRRGDVAGDGVDPVPRLIEAGLQAAGLLDIATLGRLRIPSRISSVRWFADPPDPSTPLFALARRSSAGDPDIDIDIGIDIDIVDGTGGCRMRIAGYATLPLPFDADRAAVAVLRAACNRAGRRP